MKTTLNKIRSHSPCTDGWKKLLAYLGKTAADDEPLAITTLIESNGVEDAIWCLRAVDGQDSEIRLFAVWCARQVQHLLKDKRSLDALDVAERYAKGLATRAELRAAYAAAYDAAHSAAPYAAAYDAAHSAASDAAYAAAHSAAHYAACNAAYGAASDAAHDAVRQAQAQELRRICSV